MTLSAVQIHTYGEQVSFHTSCVLSYVIAFLVLIIKALSNKDMIMILVHKKFLYCVLILQADITTYFFVELNSLF